MNLITWAKKHYWDSLEKDKDIIIRHLRTYSTEESSPVENVVKPANDVIKIIDEMIAKSKQIEAIELDADEDCDNENLIDHQGRIYALTQLKNRLSV